MIILAMVVLSPNHGLIKWETSMQAKIQTVTTSDQQQLCVKTWGDAQNTPLVLVHGYPDNQEVWEGMIQYLIHAYYIVTYDVRGAGQSSIPKRIRDYALPRLSLDLECVVNQLLPLMYFLNQQQYSAKRYELRLLEDKISQTQTVPSDTRNAQMNEIARLTRMEVQDRVRYSTITLAISQPTLVRERIDIDVDAVARLNGDSFWKRAWNGIQYGWRFVLDLLVIMITPRVIENISNAQ